jgi:hypothetical protein
VGWDIPPGFENICREVTARSGAKFFRWHPLLTGDGIIYPKEHWRTQNLDGELLPGFRGLPEFTFVCPNNPDVQEATINHIGAMAQSGRYDGIFLDRMRFPSPAADPFNKMACFCESCQKAANKCGLDLEVISRRLTNTPKLNILGTLWGDVVEDLANFLNFRQRSITQFITNIVQTIRTSGLDVGLDCFSPALTRIVGQDLNKLAPLADWVKIMIYGHAFGPATLPFELRSLANWLIDSQEAHESEMLSALVEITNLVFPALGKLPIQGIDLPTDLLVAEYENGRKMSASGKLLAGVELVEIPGVCELSEIQIEADLRAFKAVGADGLAISWDLWQIPIEHLKLVREVWFS